MSHPLLERRQIAEKFAKEQLEIMDGSFEAAIHRLGMERFEKLVNDIEKSLPLRRESERGRAG